MIHSLCIFFSIMACFFWKICHVATVPLEHNSTSAWQSILSGIQQFVCLKSSENEQKKTNHSLFTMAMWAVTYRLISAPYCLVKMSNEWSSAVQPWLSTNWLLFISAHQEKSAWSTIFFARRYYWSVQNPCFGGVLIGVENKHKWWSYIKTFWVPLCQKMTNGVRLKNQRILYAISKYLFTIWI